MHSVEIWRTRYCTVDGELTLGQTEFKVLLVYTNGDVSKYCSSIQLMG